MNVPLELLAPTLERLAWAVIHSLWQGAIVALLLAFSLRAMRRASASVRHAACLCALVAMFGMAGITAARVKPHAAALRPKPMPVSVASLLRLPDAPSAIDLPSSFPTQAAEPDLAADSFASSSQTLRQPWREQFAPILPWIACAWMAGVLTLSFRHCGGWLRVRALRRSGTAAGDELQRVFERLTSRFGFQRAVCLVQSAEALTPMLAGVFKPMIVLPARVLTGLGPAEIEAILAHELAHLARRDAWSNVAQVIIETVLFYHPAVWWIGRRARIEREHAADDLALSVCTDRRVYAGALVRLAELEVDPAFALAATGGNLMGRIRRIVVPPPPETAPSSLSFGVPVAAATLMLAAALASRAIAEDPPIVVAPGESIQAAIDKAPEGAVIRLGEGEWKERIVITRPLILEGMGWEKTRITIEEPSPEEGAKANSDLQTRQAGATTDADKRASARAWVRDVAKPAVWIHDASSVKLRKLRIQGRSNRDRNGGGTSSSLVYFQNAEGTMADCAVVGPFGQGIHIADQSDVEVTGSLVAALWGEGIVVHGRRRGDVAAPSRLHLVESEIRNIYHYGVAIGPGCDSTVIERCRISGTAWHGIRYDDASPTVAGNVIFQHARCGIYASGNTHATVKGNVFWKNEMDGISCWFGNTDAIEGNTFVGNLREGLTVIGGAKPVVSGNVFSGNPVAIECGTTSGRNGAPLPVGAPVLRNNLFHDNPVILREGGENKATPEGSVTADPMFRDPAKQDFSFASASPALAASLGASSPLAVAGPWPLLAEEKSMTPADETRDFSKWKAPGAPAAPTRKQDELADEARKLAEPWIADMFQLDDASKREAAIEHMRAAIYSSDPLQLAAGLNAFSRAYDIQFDRAPYRDRFLELLRSADGEVRAKALQGLAQCGEHLDNLEIYIRLADDPAASVRALVPSLIVGATKRDLTGRGGETILKLLNQADDQSRLPAIHCLWGVKQSPEIEARIVELSRASFSGGPGRSSYDAMYYALSTQPNRGEAAIKRCIELLADQDAYNVGGRIAWGFGSGVSKPFEPLVAEAMMRVVESRNDSYLRRQSLDRLRQYGTASQLPALQALLAKPNVTGEFRGTLQSIAAVIEKRPAPTEKGDANAAVSQPVPAVPAASTAAEKPEIEVEWRTKWWPATIAKKDGDRTLIHYVGYGSEWDEWVTSERIRPLSVAVEPAAATPSGSIEAAPQLVEKNRRAARERAAKDDQVYSRDQQREIESLYQIANTKGKRSEEARASLKELLRRFDKANRTGCATLYLGQGSEGDERLEYLTTAVEKFSDCYYFNGCQVGGYGRFVLALTLWERGEKDKARKLFNELKTTYKDATDHSGRPMGPLAEATEKKLEQKP